uniref:Probable ATP-dependent transporter ycf16 n=2 Tax=Rhodosorus marinus TaxID=101924 RepID=A0A7S2ZPD1_9RHOD|mmetsp:Transcript_27313/g.106761  ORF Transcript_27313/g.106761 Transcript_27313/m.106761 type:complete len:821 (+) Transcript_27313:249-2711(+)
MLKWFRRKGEVEDEPPGPPGPGPDEVSWWSKLSYSWINPLIKRGARRQLDPEDIWDIPRAEASSVRESEFEEEYKKRKAARTEKGLDPAPSLTRAFMKLHKRTYIIAGMLMFVSQAYNLAAPTLIQEIIIYLGDPSISPGLGYMYVIILAFGQWIGLGVCQSRSFLLMIEIGLSCRAALTAAVFKKSTNLSNSSRQNVTVGEIVNLMSNDTQRYVEVTQFLQQVWSGPLVIIVGLALLIRLVGVAALAGLALMLLTIPLQGKMFLWANSLRLEVMTHSDVRVKLMNEVLQGIKAVKLYAWEDSFEERIEEVREKEVKAIFKTSLLRGINFGIFSALPSIIAIVVLVIYSAQGNILTPEVVFPAIGYMNVLRFPLLLLPMLVTQLAQLKVSNKRLSALLEAGQMNEADRNWIDKEGSPEGGRVEVADGHFMWRIDRNDSLNKMKQKEKSTTKPQKKKRGLFRRRRESTGQGIAEDELEDVEEVDGVEEVEGVKEGEGLEEENGVMDEDTYELKNINFTAEPGEFVAIVGAVGSGKSSLISAILGEVSKLEGTVDVRGSVAYAAQTPWIFNDTLRSNIIFGETDDDAIYSKTIYATALENDLEALPAGDQTEIGEKGINLSGGQKQRVSIARAVYTDADIYILDDPLSAVDAHAGEHIFQECFRKQLRKKTRILVTNQLQFLPYTDRVYVMKGGRIVDAGTFAELNRKGTHLSQIMEAFGSTLQATVTKYDTEESEAEKGSDLLNFAHTMDMLAMKEKEKQDGRLVNAEARAHGGISQSVWLDYFRAGGEESLSGGISNRRSGLSCLAEKLSETHPLMKRCN